MKQPHQLDPTMELITCPLSHLLFAEPVAASDGYIYERDYLLSHVEKNGLISPMTRAALTADPNDKSLPQLTEMFPIKSQVSRYVANHPDVYDEDAEHTLYLPVSKWADLKRILQSKDFEALNELLRSDIRLAMVSIHQAMAQGITVRNRMIEQDADFWGKGFQQYKMLILKFLVQSGVIRQKLNDIEWVKTFFALDKNDQNNDDRSVFQLLSLMIVEGYLDIFLRFLPQLTDVNFSVDYKVTLLHLCVKHCKGRVQVAMAKALLQRGADITLVDESFEGQGSTVLHMCANVEMAVLLTNYAHDHGAAFEVKSWTRGNCLQAVANEIFNIYLLAGPHQIISGLLVDTLVKMVECGNHERLKIVLDLFPQLRGHSISHLGLTLLDIALLYRKSDTELLKTLLSNQWTTMYQRHGLSTIKRVASTLNIQVCNNSPEESKSSRIALNVKSMSGQEITFKLYPSEDMQRFRYCVFGRCFPDQLSNLSYSYLDVRLIQSGKQVSEYDNIESLCEKGLLHAMLRLKGD